MSEVCRFCGNELKHTFVDLGLSPLANEYVSRERIAYGMHYYPLHVKVCEKCFYVQTMEYKSPDSIFRNYQYFSSYSASWVEHASNYVDMIIKKRGLGKESLVAEVACNDGYLLQFFKQRQIPCYGVEPAENVAAYAEEKGIFVYKDFFNKEFGTYLAENGKKVDLLIGNNVMAHVPDINSFIEGIAMVLKEKGIATFEFPHLLNLLNEAQFDTIYHEHFSYLSVIFLKYAMEKHNLKIYDIEKLSTHGGSLRIYIAHKANHECVVSEAVEKILKEEREGGLDKIETYIAFGNRVKAIKRNIITNLSAIKDVGAKIAAYGAAAKGNTLLNYCGIGRDMIDFVVDASPHKQGLFLPGTLIPIVNMEYMKENKPDYIIILPWNLKDEIVGFLDNQGLDSKYITLIPEFKILNE